MIPNRVKLAELKRIAAQHGGLISPEEVVEAARPASSPLHKLFDWNDSKAAELWRLEQARRLLRVTVEHLQVEDRNFRVRAYMSLTPDRRSKDGGSYRKVEAILNNTQFREQLLQDAVQEMHSFEHKYRRLAELNDVFSAMQRVAKKLKNKKSVTA